jgi:signal transduction histidine kinase
MATGGNMVSDKFNKWKDPNWFILIALMMIGISLLHLTTATGAIEIHQFLRRLYYIPIILAAYRFRLKGGLISSILCGVLYAPHLLLYLSFQFEVINQFMEIILFVVVGTTTGILAQAEYNKRVQLSKQLQKVREMEEEVRVADRLAAVGQLATGIAHEIRNPLGIIKAAAQLARDEQVDNPEINESVAVILSEVERANQVVTQLLDFARPGPVKFTFVDLKSLGNEVVNIIGQYAARHKVKLAFQFPEHPLYISGDSELIKQVLVNLMMNAVQASSDDDKIELKIYKTNSDSAAIEILDEGSGIPEENLPRIFDPFFTTRKHGTGLGLAIVHRIVRDHGGSIKVRSKPDLGTTITLCLPLINTMEG